jgi:hypothetical protein
VTPPQPILVLQMATFDKLADEQRAIIELVLQRGQSYDDLSGMLGMPATRVRDMAREALGELAPNTAGRVDPEWRGQVADYVLGQQSGPESTATRGHLKRSEPARTWALSLVDSLDHLYTNGAKPIIPDGDEPAGRAATPAPTPPRANGAPAVTDEPRARTGGPLSAGARRVVLRRRIIGAAVVAAAVIVALVLIIGGGDDDKSSNASSGQNASQNQQARLLAQGVLRATGGEQGAGIAAVFERGGQRQLVVQASGLKPSGSRQAYEVWLYNSRSDAKSVGAQVTDRQGNYQGAGPLPADYQKYRYVDVSREPLNSDTKHSGESVLRGRLGPPQQQGSQQQQGG